MKSVWRSYISNTESKNTILLGESVCTVVRTQLFCSQNWWSSLTVVWIGFGDFDENLIEKSGILPDKTNFHSTSDLRSSADSYPLVTRRYLRKSAWSNSFISGDYPRSRPQHHSIPPRRSYSIFGEIPKFHLHHPTAVGSTAPQKRLKMLQIRRFWPGQA